MRRAGFFFVGVSALLLALPVMAQDPVKVDPKHYKLEFENDHVRVLRITYGPHEKSVMHEHPASVAVDLTDGYVKFTHPDGKAEENRWKADQAVWEPGVKHLPENLAEEPFEAILVELKSSPRTTVPAIDATEDSVKVAANQCKVEFENDHVRVLRWKIGPHEETPMHAHPPSVVVLLTDTQSRFALGDGTTREGQGKAGQAIWADAEKHASENLRDEATELIQIELKGTPAAQHLIANLEIIELGNLPGVPLPACVTAAILRSDAATGAVTLLGKMTHGCLVPWHWHSPNEQVMSVRGLLRVQFKGEDPVLLKEGGFAFFPARRIHQVGCLSESCLFYVATDGAFDIHYVNDADEEISPDKAFGTTVK